MYQLRITLQSDLCAADGDGFASVIDTDIVTDEHGIPYIPARRLKGCLREAAVYIGSEQIDAIFGVRGAMDAGSLHIANARIAEYSAVQTAAKLAKMSAQSVTELFTATVASTALGAGGSAEENTLRFLRAVCGTTPWNEKPLEFLADVQIDEAYAAEFGRICKALRHIGYKRSRGFGAVSCRLEPCGTQQTLSVPEQLDADKRYTLTYAVCLDEPLMLPGKALDETRDYVSGQQMIGTLAGAYLKDHPADAAFEELFLNENVRFSNLYLTDEKLREYIPVPQYLGKSKDKADAKLVLDMIENDKLEPGKKKILKPIKSGYINQAKEIRKVRTERVYHNAVNSKEESKLYTQNCLQAGQYLRGTITAPGAQLSVIAKLLCNEPLRFGRSKTAQYAQCRLAAVTVTPESDSKVQISKEQQAVYALVSDVILMDAFGNYDASFGALCQALGLEPDAVDQQHSSLKHTTVTGFLTVIGLQKAHIRAIAAGSIIVLKSGSQRTLPGTVYVGEQLNAGFGQVRVFPADQLLAGVQTALQMQSENAGNSEIRAYFESLRKDQKMELCAVQYARDQAYQLTKKPKIWTAAFLGRVTLMVKQSDSQSDLDSRINSIKSKNKHDAADKMLKNANPEHYGTWDYRQQYLLTILTVLKYRIKQNDLAKKRREKS